MIQTIYATTAQVDDLIPGELVYLHHHSPDGDPPVTYRGRDLPFASISGSAGVLPIGVLALSQARVVQTLAAFGVYRLEVVVSGVARTNLRAPSSRAVGAPAGGALRPGDGCVISADDGTCRRSGPGISLGRVVLLDPCPAGVRAGHGFASVVGEFIRLFVGPIIHVYT